MRLAAISPDELDAEQKPLYDDMSQGIQTDFKGFVNVREDGALLGPWNPWIRQPKFGKPVWELVKTMVAEPSLPAPVREVAILFDQPLGTHGEDIELGAADDKTEVLKQTADLVLKIALDLDQ